MNRQRSQVATLLTVGKNQFAMKESSDEALSLHLQMRIHQMKTESRSPVEVELPYGQLEEEGKPLSLSNEEYRERRMKVLVGI